MTVSNTGRVITFGFDDLLLSSGRREPVSWHEDYATNGHMLIAGKSGTGKSFMLRRIIGQMIRPLPGRALPRVHIFDVHDDIRIEGESRVDFSEISQYGINPLRHSSHPRFGGIRKCVEGFIDMMNESTSEMGHRQQAALKNALYDLYAERGFSLHDPGTWDIDGGEEPVPDSQGRIYLDVPYEERDLAKQAAKSSKVTFAWCPQERCWWCSEYRGGMLRWGARVNGRQAPTIHDAVRFLQDRLRRMQIGASGKCVRNLAEHNKKVKAWNKLTAKLARTGLGAAEVEDLKEDVRLGAQELIDSFTEYVLSIESGEETEEVLRFDSPETLMSLLDRMHNMVASGIFGRHRPKFDPAASCWVYSISSLRDSEQKFFVWSCLRQIFDNAREMGQVAGASEVREVIVLDEAHKFFTPKEANILDILSREARKFGIALIAASQSPNHFSEDFLSNVGTKILLGLDEGFYTLLARKMRVDESTLNCVIPKKVAAIQVSDSREVKNIFRRTRVGN